MLHARLRLAALGVLSVLALAPVAQAQPHNVIIFVADGLRSKIVTPQTAPALAEVRDKGVDFANSHSLFPTVTTPNASAIATGHRLGDTGDFGNMLYVGPAPMGFPVGGVIAGLVAARRRGVSRPELLTVVANIGSAVALYPLMRRSHPGFAMGYVTERVVESTMIAVADEVAGAAELVLVHASDHQGGTT